MNLASPGHTEGRRLNLYLGFSGVRHSVRHRRHALAWPPPELPPPAPAAARLRLAGGASILNDRRIDPDRALRCRAAALSRRSILRSRITSRLHMWRLIAGRETAAASRRCCRSRVLQPPVFAAPARFAVGRIKALPATLGRARTCRPAIRNCLFALA